mmetsp:Transcript_12414/g.40743  ORF Transcript_12414/g.40743 Transcript_12414/m.40743 type:complete len:122 (+) Transcript_12414:383-748(+)
MVARADAGGVAPCWRAAAAALLPRSAWLRAEASSTPNNVSLGVDGGQRRRGATSPMLCAVAQWLRASTISVKNRETEEAPENAHRKKGTDAAGRCVSRDSGFRVRRIVAARFGLACISAAP